MASKSHDRVPMMHDPVDITYKPVPDNLIALVLVFKGNPSSPIVFWVAKEAKDQIEHELNNRKQTKVVAHWPYEKGAEYWIKPNELAVFGFEDDPIKRISSAQQHYHHAFNLELYNLSQKAREEQLESIMDELNKPDEFIHFARTSDVSERGEGESGVGGEDGHQAPPDADPGVRE